MYGGCPPWGEFHGLPHYVRVDCTDTGDRVWVQLGRFAGTDPDDGTHYDDDDIASSPTRAPSPTPSSPGPPAALNAWLWRRGDGADVSVTGDGGHPRPLPRGGQPPDQLTNRETAVKAV